MHHPTDRIIHTTAFVTPVVEHWLEREIAQWVHPTKDRSDDPSHHERTLLPRSYISLPTYTGCAKYHVDIEINLVRSYRLNTCVSTLVSVHTCIRNTPKTINYSTLPCWEVTSQPPNTAYHYEWTLQNSYVASLPSISQCRLLLV